jgi:hypothetical protein
MKFDLYSASDAPEASRSTLESVEKAYGFVPNLFRVFAASPAALEAYVALDTPRPENTDKSPTARAASAWADVVRRSLDAALAPRE